VAFKPLPGRFLEPGTILISDLGKRLSMRRAQRRSAGTVPCQSPGLGHVPSPKAVNAR
jgi:hypothetical protein